MPTLGCGPGFFTVPIAKYVFDGKVYAVDIQQKMLDAVKDSVEKVRLGNVEPVLSKENKLPLDDDSIDGAFLAFVLQEAEKPVSLLKQVKRCLRKGGWLAILRVAQGGDG